MPAVHLHWLFQRFGTVAAGLLRFVLFNSPQQLLSVFLLGKLRVVDPPPTLPLGGLEVLLELPASFEVGAIVQVEAAVAEGAVAGVVPVLAEVEHIVEPAGVFDGGVEPRRPHLLLVGLLRSADVVAGELVVGVGVHPSVDLGVQLPLLYEPRGLHVLHKPLFGELLLQLVGRQLEVLDQASAGLVVDVLK